MSSAYDNEHFFEAYSEMPRSKCGLSAAGEWHQLQKMFPDLNGKRVLDLGCGYGWHCKYAAEIGAAEIIGIDSSEKMLQKAKAEHADQRITYEVCGIEEYAYPENAFDFVLSNLALHYIKDLDNIYRKVHRTLKKGGYFLFNIEHPVFTAGVHQEWFCDDQGAPLHWPVDNYYYPGTRETIFLGQTVQKEHHTLTQIINPLLQIGFQLDILQEATPSEDMLTLPGMADEMRRPMMLMIRARKF